MSLTTFFCKVEIIPHGRACAGACVFVCVYLCVCVYISHHDYADISHLSVIYTMCAICLLHTEILSIRVCEVKINMHIHHRSVYCG